MSYSSAAPLRSQPAHARARAPRLASLLGGILLAGCSAPVVDEIDEAAEAADASTQVFLLIDRSDRVQPERAPGPAHSNVSAKFIRLPASADRASVERVLGARLDLPALGDCAELTPPDPAPADFAAAGPIELLDVGDVTLRMGDQAMPLAPRAFPDVGGFVSGVFYTSRDAERDLPPSLAYVLEASGSSEKGPLRVPAEAPAPLELITVEGAPLESDPLLEEGSSVRLGWTASGSPSDFVYVDLAPASGASRGPGLRCAFGDAGEGVIPAEVLAQVASGAESDEVSISLHRVRQLAFSTSEVEHGEIRFDLSVGARLAVRAQGDASHAP